MNINAFSDAGTVAQSRLARRSLVSPGGDVVETRPGSSQSEGLSSSPPSPKWHSRRVLRVVLTTISSTKVPSIIMLLCCGLLVALYYSVPSFGSYLDEFSEAGENMGYAFPVILSGIFGGLIPSLFLISSGELKDCCRRPVSPGDKKTTGWIFVVFLVCFWGKTGLIQALFFDAQTALFGANNDLKTIVYKTLFDQFVWNPFFMTWYIYLWMSWKELRFHLGGFADQFRTPRKRAEMLQGVMCQQIAAWLTWIPAVALIYSLPDSLHVLAFNFVLVVFSCAVNALVRGQVTESSGDDNGTDLHGSSRSSNQDPMTR